MDHSVRPATICHRQSLEFEFKIQERHGGGVHAMA